MNNYENSTQVVDVQNKKPGGDNVFDISRLIRLVLKNWYLFVISFPLCLGSVFIYHRYTVPVYKASATLLLKGSEQGAISQTDLMQGFGLSPEMRSVENQSFIIRSRNTIKKTIDRLDFAVSYYQKGRFKDSELYLNAPFTVEFDSVHPQLLNVPFEVMITDNNEFHLKISCENGVLHNYKEQRYAGRVGPLTIEKELQNAEWTTGQQYSFKITRKEGIAVTPGASYYFVFKSHNQITNEYRSSVGVSPYREGSSILFITSSGTSRGKIVRFLDELCEVILENNLDKKNDMATRSIAFIESQLNTLSDTLDRVQNRLSSYRKANRFMGPSEFSQKLADKYYETESELKVLRLQIEYYEFLKDNLQDPSDFEDFLLPAVDNENTSLVNELVAQLIEQQKELNLLESSASMDNQYVVNLNKGIDITVELLNKAINQVIRNYKLEKQKVENELNSILADMDKLPELEKDYLIIDRTYKLNDAIYTFLLQKHSETQISKASNVPDNEVIDNASIVALVSPNKSNDYKKGLMLALLIPAVFIGLKEFLNTRVRGKDDVKALVPRVPLLGVVVHDKTGVENVVNEFPHSIISESFRSIRTKLKFMAGTQNVQVITLTSSNTGEGKTFCAQNLASVFAISGKKTVLVGFDMRKPRLTSLYNLQNRAGLSNYFIGQVEVDDIIYNTGEEGVDVIPAGPIPPNPSELIVGEKTDELYNYLRQQFDVIIIDSPPVGLVADARLLMQHSDCNLFIVRSGYTSKEHMVQTLDNLVEEKVEGLGIVLNDVTANDKEYGYYSAEYYGSRG